MFNVKICQLVILGIVAGCTTQPAKDHGTSNATAGGPDVQCHVEPVAGSMIDKTVCTTKAQRDAQQADVNGLKNTLQSQSGGCRTPCTVPGQ